MNKYNDSKIYKIVDHTTGNIYVGSTKQKYLSQRLENHRRKYKSCLQGYQDYTSSFKILENGNYDIVLLENVNCETKDQLFKRERFYIESLECVNKTTAGRTKKEYHEANKESLNKIRLKIIECECGSSIQTCEKARHYRSKKHQTFINSK